MPLSPYFRDIDSVQHHFNPSSPPPPRTAFIHLMYTVITAAIVHRHHHRSSPCSCPPDVVVVLKTLVITVRITCRHWSHRVHHHRGCRICTCTCRYMYETCTSQCTCVFAESLSEQALVTSSVHALNMTELCSETNCTGSSNDTSSVDERKVGTALPGPFSFDHARMCRFYKLGVLLILMVTRLAVASACFYFFFFFVLVY